MTHAGNNDNSTADANRRCVERLVRASDLLAHAWPLALGMNPNGDGGYDGSCPCCEIHGDGFEVEVHCWRTGCEHGCEFSGIHVSGSLDRTTLLKIAEHIRDNNGWTNSTDWTLVICPNNGGRPPEPAQRA